MVIKNVTVKNVTTVFDEGSKRLQIWFLHAKSSLGKEIQTRETFLTS